MGDVEYWVQAAVKGQLRQVARKRRLFICGEDLDIPSPATLKSDRSKMRGASLEPFSSYMEALFLSRMRIREEADSETSVVVQL